MSNYKIALMIIILLNVSPLFAQAPPPATPIDGGLSLLLMAGGIYGLKKLRDSKN